MDHLKKLSKFLSLILRHEPAQFGLTLDEHGFTDAQTVWQVVEQKYGTRFTWQDMEQVIAGDQDGKKRYELVGGQIRAMYGHSRQIQTVTYEPAVPPTLLYHGTDAKALSKIRAEGLKALGRQYVHLTTNLQRATKVGQRHGSQTVILAIQALQAHEQGVVFYHPETEHYLTTQIPPQYIDFP